MGAFWDEVYRLENGVFRLMAQGSYTADSWEWNGVPVTEDEYLAGVAAAFDRERAVWPEDMKTEDEMLLFLLSGEEPGGAPFSGGGDIQEKASGGVYSAYADTAAAWKDIFQRYVSGGYVTDAEMEGLLSFSELIWNKQEFGTGDGDMVTFFIYDISGDDIPELFMCLYDRAGQTCSIAEIFSWDEAGGHVVKITPEYLELTLFWDGVVMARTGHGSATYDMYVYRGGPSMTLIDSYGYYYGSDGDERSFHHDGADYSLGERITDEEMTAVIDSHGLLTYVSAPVTEANCAHLRAGELSSFEETVDYTEPPLF